MSCVNICFLLFNGKVHKPAVLCRMSEADNEIHECNVYINNECLIYLQPRQSYKLQGGRVQVNSLCMLKAALASIN